MTGACSRKFSLCCKRDSSEKGGGVVGGQALCAEMICSQLVALRDSVDDPRGREGECHIVDDFPLPCFVVVEGARGKNSRLRLARFGDELLGAPVYQGQD